MTTTRAITPEQMAVYRATAARKARAHVVARQAATRLRTQVGATDVLPFGSLVHDPGFTATSDIDLAAWGIAPADFFRAVAYLQDLSPEFSIDLVTMEDCKATLRTTILGEGQAL